MRKKFTMLLASLLCCVWGEAQVTNLEELVNDACYSLKGERGFIAVSDNYVKGSNDDDLRDEGVTENASDPNQQFAILSYDGNYYLYSVGAKKFVVKEGDKAILSDTPTQACEIVTASDVSTDFDWIIKLGGYYMNLSNASDNGVYTNYNFEDPGNRWSITYASTFDSADALAAIETEISKYVKTVADFSNDYVYTFISNRNVKDYMMYDAAYTNVVAWYKYQNLAAGDDVANCQWAVYKSENGNYYMYNIGAKKFLGTASDNNAAIPFAEAPQTMDLIFKVTSVATHPIMISTNGGDGTLNHNSAYNDGVSNWDNNFGGTDDPGNVHKVRRVADISSEDKAKIATLVEAFESTTIFAELTTLIGEVEAAIVEANNGVGTLTAEAAATLSEAVAAAKNIEESNSYAEIEAAIGTLQNAYDAAEYVIVVPTAGQYYTFASANKNKGDYENALVYAGEDNKLYWSNTKKATDAAAVWYYDGSVLKNVHTGCYINGFIDLKPSPLAATGETVTFDQTIGKGQTKITVADKVMHTQYTSRAVVNWNTDPTLGSSSAFYVSEVDAMEISHLLNVSSAGWASLVLGYNATIPSGIKAYTVSSVANGYATLNEINGVIPANTPVLIEAAQGNYEFTYAKSAASVGDNMLAGKPYHTYLTTVEGTTNYVLSVDDNGENIGLYKKTVYDVDMDDDTSTYEAILFAANKAYLPVSTSSDEAANAIGLNRGEGTTSIDEAQLTIDNVVIYDLTGRRVEKMEKGIYIVNGKKIIK